MNIFRLTGDLSHLLAIIILLLKETAAPHLFIVQKCRQYLIGKISGSYVSIALCVETESKIK
jgi:hypothetical protein